MIRVIVADDQAIVRDGLVTVLSLLPDIEIVGEAANGEEAVALAADLSPDVILMDLRMPVLDGAAATARVLAANPAIGVLVLTTFADDESIAGALRAGARGYLTKDAGRGEIAAAIRSTAEGQSTFGPEIGSRLVERLMAGEPLIGALAEVASGGEAAAAASVRSRFPSLTPREAEALELIAAGLSNAEIAERMFVSVATVKSYVNAIFAKLALRDRAQAIALVRS
ncbi:response regulator transcription factor [soil metagenome]